jgi:hypothetical protein
MRLLLLTLLTGSLGIAATSCLTVGGSIANPVACQIQGPGQAISSAQSSSSFSIAGNEVTTNTFTSVGAVASNTGAAISTATASINITLVTDGPARAGFVQRLNTALPWQHSSDGFSGDFQYSLNSFQLGTAFQLIATQSFTAFADPNVIGVANGVGVTSMQFRFFEADGKTPVAVSLAPEPSSLALLVLAVIHLLLNRRSVTMGWLTSCDTSGS